MYDCVISFDCNTSSRLTTLNYFIDIHVELLRRFNLKHTFKTLTHDIIPVNCRDGRLTTNVCHSERGMLLAADNNKSNDRLRSSMADLNMCLFARDVLIEAASHISAVMNAIDTSIVAS